MKGRYSSDNTSYLIEEIIGIVFDVNVPSSVAFINPFIKDLEWIGACWFSGDNWHNNEDEFEIDDEQSASDQNETLVLEGDLTWISFTKPFDAYKQEQMQDSSKLIMAKLAER